MLNDGNTRRCGQGMVEQEPQQQWKDFFPLSLKGNGVGGQGPEPAQSHRLGRGARTAATPWLGPQWPAGRRE